MARIAVLSTAHIHSAGFCRQLVTDSGHGAPYAIWDDDDERGRRYASEYDSRFVADLDELLADEAVDGFLVTAENTRHLALLERVLPCGKPVLCEKPLATTETDVAQITRLVTEHPAPLIAGYFLPFSGAMQAVAAALAAERFGHITHISHRNAHHGAYGRWFDNPDLAWFVDPDSSGGGALLDLGTHSVHLVRTLFGPVDTVWATIGNHAGIYPSVDDLGIILLRFRSGVLGRIEASWLHHGGPRGLEIAGATAGCWQEGGEIRIQEAGAAATPLPPVDSQPDRIGRLLACCAGELPETDWRADLACSLDAVTIMCAAYRSAASGSWENVTSGAPR